MRESDAWKGVLATLLMLVVFMLVMSLAMLVLSGCARSREPILVKVVAPIPNQWPSCVLEDAPKAPEFLSEVGSSDNPDVIDRVFVHRRDYYNMIQFANDMSMWAGRINTCINRLTQDAPP